MYKIQSQNISKESSRYTQVMINGMPWVNTLRYTPKVTKHQNSRQLGGGWVCATLSAISRQKVTLIIVNDPLFKIGKTESLHINIWLLALIKLKYWGKQI